MHSVTVGSRIAVGATVIEPNTPYFMSNILTGTLMSNDTPVNGVPFSSTVKAISKPSIRLKGSEDVWLMRTGGFGDLLMLTPTIRHLIAQGHTVHVICDKSYHCVFEGLEFALKGKFKVHLDPIAISEIPETDTLVCYEGVIEGSEEAKKVHAVDLFAQWAGIKQLKDRTLMYCLGQSELAQATLHYKKGNRKRIGIQAKASALVRTYDANLLAQVIDKLRMMGHEIFLFGAPGDITCDIPGVINLAVPGLPFRKSVAVLSTCDVVFAPDSALAHVAQAIHKPLFALYGSFPALLRLTGDPKITDFIDARGECAPCFHHCGVRPENKWPLGGPCKKADFCTVLASVSPDRIVDRIVNLLGLTPQGVHERKERSFNPV